MKLHRLVLRNYRGISYRDIEFPDRGVVVVSGANEIGKSSMIEALDLLLEAKDRSTKKEVKQVKPTHLDEGAEITAVISTGPYRFEYHKRFHKKQQTSLTISSPVREQFTGDEAHDRVQAILAETVDTELWHAQRVLQTGSTACVDLSGCDALARALDAAAGQADALSGCEPLLIDKIDAEFRQYFTATGRPTGPWAAAVGRLRDVQNQVDLSQAQVDEVDEAVAGHARLAEELERLTGERARAAQRLGVAGAAADAVQSLSAQLAQARARAEAAEMARAASDAALAERRRLRAELAERSAAIEGLETAVVAASAAEVEATAAAVVATAASEAARAAVERIRLEVDAARSAVERIARRDEATKLTARLARIDAAEGELRGVRAELEQITLSDAVMRDIETAVLTTEKALAQAEFASVRVELEASTAVAVVVAGELVELGPGAGRSQNVTTSTAVEVPGVLTVRVVPGAPAADSQDKLDRAQRLLRGLLDEAGVADVAAARSLDARRRDLISSLGRLEATHVALLGDETVAALQARLVELADGALDPTDDPDGPDAHSHLQTVTSALREAGRERESLHDSATAADSVAVKLAGAVSVAQTKLATARDEVTAVAERLARQRESVSDDQLAIQSEADGERARGLAAEMLATEAELAAAAPAAVAAELTAASAVAKDVGGRHDEVVGQLRELTAQLRVYGSEGRKGRLDAALTEREHARAEHGRVQRRATAAQLLQSVMNRHRDQSRLRYVNPFRAEVERLGRIVFGEDFEVEIDGELRMLSRTLSGRTVPFDSLSGGAKEQLGIVARLASAALVAADDGVPVVIDDALGFSDPERLAKMGRVFDAVGGDGQVIVLTCSPERYTGIVGAQHLELAT